MMFGQVVFEIDRDALVKQTRKLNAEAAKERKHAEAKAKHAVQSTKAEIEAARQIVRRNRNNKGSDEFKAAKAKVAMLQEQLRKLEYESSEEAKYDALEAAMAARRRAAEEAKASRDKAFRERAAEEVRKRKLLKNPHTAHPRGWNFSVNPYHLIDRPFAPLGPSRPSLLRIPGTRFGPVPKDKPSWVAVPEGGTFGYTAPPRRLNTGGLPSDSDSGSEDDVEGDLYFDDTGSGTDGGGEWDGVGAASGSGGSGGSADGSADEAGVGAATTASGSRGAPSRARSAPVARGAASSRQSHSAARSRSRGRHSIAGATTATGAAARSHAGGSRATGAKSARSRPKSALERRRKSEAKRREQAAAETEELKNKVYGAKRGLGRAPWAAGCAVPKIFSKPDYDRPPTAHEQAIASKLKQADRALFFPHKTGATPWVPNSHLSMPFDPTPNRDRPSFNVPVARAGFGESQSHISGGWD